MNHACRQKGIPKRRSLKKICQSSAKLAEAIAHARAISDRTKAALAAAKARGTKLGNPIGAAALASKGNKEAVSAVHANADKFAATIEPIIASIRASGINSANAIANALNAQGVVTARGKLWTARAVMNVEARLG